MASSTRSDEVVAAAPPTSDPQGSFASLFLPLLLSYAQSRGVDARALAERHSIPFVTAAAVTARLGQVDLVAEELSLLLDEPHIAIGVAAHAPRGLWGVGELAARFASTVDEAMKRTDRYSRLIPPHQRIAWTHAPDEVRCAYRVPSAARPFIGRHSNEFVVARLLRFVGELVGKELTPRALWFLHAAPADDSSVRRRFAAADIRFGAEENGFSLPLDVARMKVVSADAPTHSALVAYAESLLPPTAPGGDPFVTGVEAAIARSLPGGAPPLAGVAKELAISPRTMQRRLGEHGRSFAEMVDAVRRSLAERHLTERGLTVSEIAALLGYADGRAFARAFGRWTGVAPVAWRRDRGGP